MDRGRRDGVRGDGRLHGGRSGLALRPRLAAGRVGASHDARHLSDARASADPAREPRRRSHDAPLGRDDRRAVEQRPVRVARRARLREGTDPDRELLGRHRGRRVLPLGDDATSDEAVFGGLSRAGRADGRLRRRRPVGARRSRRARMHACVAGDDARNLGRSRAISRRRTGAASPASGRTATGRRSTTTGTGSCMGARTTH